MGEIRKLKPLTDWIEFRLDPKCRLIDPPIVRVRLRMISDLDDADAVEAGARTMSSFMLGRALAAIVEWDLVLEGAPVPCNEETKAKEADGLKELLAQRMEGFDPEIPRYLATEICKVAQNQENFLKN